MKFLPLKYYFQHNLTAFSQETQYFTSIFSIRMWSWVCLVAWEEVHGGLARWILIKVATLRSLGSDNNDVDSSQRDEDLRLKENYGYPPLD